MPILSRSSGAVTLFDIRLNNLHKNVIVLRGSPGNAASVHLTGNVVLALSEPLSIKRITLKIYGKIRLQWTDTSAISRTGAARHYRYENYVYEKEWPNLELASSSIDPSTTSLNTSSSSNNTSNTGLSSSNNNNSSSLIGLNHLGSSSHGSSTPSSTHTLRQGNHEFPFETVIPGSVDESVEGLEGGHVIYRIVATIERGRFTNNVTCKRHLRIVRTLGSDILELSQSVSIDNTWPKKIDYSISIPNKALAVGSIINISMELSPLLKGLKLGTIRILLVEQVNLAIPSGAHHQYERCVVEHVIPSPPNGLLGYDVWSINETFALPANLSKCTQDCIIHSNIKVGHKLKFAVSLKNPDGHTSELRASLPVYVFISPNVPVRAPDSSHTVIFDQQNSTNANIRSTDLVETNAPPNYADHVYDRLWCDIAPANFDSPIHSGAATPLHSRSRRNSSDHGVVSSSLAMTPAPQHLSDAHARSVLVDNLRQLQIQQHAATASDDSSAPPPLTAGNNSNSNSGTNLQGLYATNSGGSDNSNGSSSSANNNGITITARQTLTSHTANGGVNTGSGTTGGSLSQVMASLGSHRSGGGSSGTNTPGGFESHAQSLASALSNSADLSPIPPQSPDFMHLSHPVSPSLSSAPSHAQLEILSRVPSYQTAINSDTLVEVEEAPLYEDSVRHLSSSALSSGSGHITAGTRTFTQSATNLMRSASSGNSASNLRRGTRNSRSAVHLREIHTASTINDSTTPNNNSNNPNNSGVASTPLCSNANPPGTVQQQQIPTSGGSGGGGSGNGSTSNGSAAQTQALFGNPASVSASGASALQSAASPSRPSSPAVLTLTPTSLTPPPPAILHQPQSSRRVAPIITNNSARSRSHSMGAVNSSAGGIMSTSGGMASVPPTLVEHEISHNFFPQSTPSSPMGPAPLSSSASNNSTSSFGSFMRGRNASFSTTPGIAPGSMTGNGNVTSFSVTPGVSSGTTSSISGTVGISGNSGRYRVRSGQSSTTVSGSSTPQLSSSNRSHSTRFLLEEATKFLHLGKLSPSSASAPSTGNS